MIWIISGVFIGGFLFGVLFMAVLAMARDSEARPSIQDEGGPRLMRLKPEIAD